MGNTEFYINEINFIYLNKGDQQISSEWMISTYKLSLLITCKKNNKKLWFTRGKHVLIPTKNKIFQHDLTQENYSIKCDYFFSNFS